jgi:hypothetical protein
MFCAKKLLKVNFILMVGMTIRNNHDAAETLKTPRVGVASNEKIDRCVQKFIFRAVNIRSGRSFRIGQNVC